MDDFQDVKSDPFFFYLQRSITMVNEHISRVCKPSSALKLLVESSDCSSWRQPDVEDKHGAYISRKLPGY